MKLPELRKQINVIDREWISLLGRRLKIAQQIALIKKQQKQPILDEEREKEIKETLLRLSVKLKLNPQFVEEILQRVLDYTKQEMQRMADEEPK